MLRHIADSEFASLLMSCARSIDLVDYDLCVVIGPLQRDDE